MALVTRRVKVYDDGEFMGVDYEADEVIRASSHIKPADLSTPAQRKRFKKLLAIKTLQDAGWKRADIAEVLEMTERHVSRRKGILRALAEEMGRV